MMSATTQRRPMVDTLTRERERERERDAFFNIKNKKRILMNPPTLHGARYCSTLNFGHQSVEADAQDVRVWITIF